MSTNVLASFLGTILGSMFDLSILFVLIPYFIKTNYKTKLILLCSISLVIPIVLSLLYDSMLIEGFKVDRLIARMIAFIIVGLLLLNYQKSKNPR